jgi:hypothetical protein
MVELYKGQIFEVNRAADHMNGLYFVRLEHFDGDSWHYDWLGIDRHYLGDGNFRTPSDIQMHIEKGIWTELYAPPTGQKCIKRRLKETAHG